MTKAIIMTKTHNYDKKCVIIRYYVIIMMLQKAQNYDKSHNYDKKLLL